MSLNLYVINELTETGFKFIEWAYSQGIIDSNDIEKAFLVSEKDTNPRAVEQAFY